MTSQIKSKRARSKVGCVRITVVYDNNPIASGLQTAWGFACVVETSNNKILFDTGQDGTILLNNMQKLNIDCANINLIVISNILHDHIRGLSEVLKENQKASVYIPESCLPTATDIFRNSADRFVGIKSAVALCPGIFTLGALPGYVCEQVLVLRSSNGLVLVSGCGRPGIHLMVNKARQVFPGEPIYFALGGFHLGRLNNSDIAQIVTSFRKYGIKKVAPCHCSGGIAREFFRQEYRNNYVDIGVGGIVEFSIAKTVRDGL